MAAALERMSQTASEAPRALRGAIRQDLAQVTRTTEAAAARAAQAAVEGVREELTAERLKFSQSAGEARRAAWRSFGGFWVWLVAMLATGALLGALATIFVVGARTAYDFGDRPERYCRLAGGQEGQNDSGREYCVFWYE